MVHSRIAGVVIVGLGIGIGLAGCSRVVQGEAAESVSQTTSESSPPEQSTAPVETTVGANTTVAADSTAPRDPSMPDVAALSRMEEVACQPSGLMIPPTCYTLTVPEDWANPDPDDQVVLQVAVFSATDPANAADDPLIYLDGGPGQNTLDVLRILQDSVVEPYLAERDVIVFDQRGAGRSQPNLRCDEAAELALEDAQGRVPSSEAADRWLAAFAACNERLAADGVDFSAYNSIASAHDVEAIRVGLDYDQLNVLGISYGTRLAQTFMRLYPTSLRAVVLDSVVPVEADLHEMVTGSVERSLRLVFDACANDAGCAGTYPTFEEDYFALLDRLDAEPAEVEVTDLDGTPYTFVIDGDDLIRLTFSALYDKSFFASLPKLVSDVKLGDLGSLGTLATVDLIGSHFTSDGMHFSVECNEEVPFESIDDLRANQPTEPPYDRLRSLDQPFTYFDVCERWNAGAAPPVENEPVISDIPTLVLTGTFDPITPPSYARQVANHLDAATVIEFPTEGHGLAPSECGAEVVASFLDDPTVAPDAACVDGVEPPQWVPAGGEIALVPFEVGPPVRYRGLRPEGWNEQTEGFFARQQFLNDAAGIAIRATAGGGPEKYVPLMDTPDLKFGELLPTDVDGQRWTTYGAEEELVTHRLLFDPANQFMVIFAAPKDEFDQLFATVAVPVAASLKLG